MKQNEETGQKRQNRQNRQNRQKRQAKAIHGHIHDIKTSLQTLMVANEMVMENAKEDRVNKDLLNTMMSDILRINETVDMIAKDFGEEDS